MAGLRRVGDEHHPPGRDEGPDTTDCLEEHGVGTGDTQELLGPGRPAERPEPGAPAAGQDDGTDISVLHVAPERSDDLLQEAPDLFLDGGQVLLRVRLEAEHDHGLGVRGPDQPPAAREGGAHAVDVDDGIARRQRPADGLDDLELDLVGGVDADLRRHERLREVSHHRRKPFLRPRQDLEEAGRGVDRVVEAEPALLEEDVAAHLARERSVLLP